MQKLGQHFLKNDMVAKKIIAALELRAGDSVIEIGPGHGELTVPLAHACAAAGASLMAIEKDVRLADGLHKKIAEEKIGVEIECDDALKILPKAIAKIKKGDGAAPTLNLVGNLPYYITGKLLRIISELEPDLAPERCIFMLQREVAERMVAAPPAMNRLAASVQFWADAKIIAHVPRADFSPPPKIDSAVIELITKTASQNPLATIRTKPPALLSPTLYYEAVRVIFAQPRKTLLNNITAASIPLKKIPTNTLKREIIERFEKIEIDPMARPQDLSVEQIISIANALLWG
jgi:16S rRNA (adenine1518-N6/adenine1519-N6)-dimethyltransferase